MNGTCPTHLNLLDLIAQVNSGEGYKFYLKKFMHR
jgi:hypothetical protein